MKYSTGKKSRVKHATAREWDEIEVEHPVKHSTGEKSPIRHTTGIQFDSKSIHSKPKEEGDEYLDLYYNSMKKKRKENVNSKEEGTVKRGKKKVIKKSV